jgi:hypothetical protein
MSVFGIPALNCNHFEIYLDTIGMNKGAFVPGPSADRTATQFVCIGDIEMRAHASSTRLGTLECRHT